MIKRIAISLLLLGLAVYFILAVSVFNRPREGMVCTGMSFHIEDSLHTGFITESDVRHILTRAGQYPEGRLLDSINLRQMEKALNANAYIDTAQCYKTATGNICVNVVPHQPVLHVINSKGEDFYLDTRGRILPRGDFNADLPVVTGHADSTYVQKNLTALGRILLRDAFWNHQIEQIHVQPSGNIELTPRVGRHTILLGPPGKYRDKLERLRLFYTQGLNKAGWNRYRTISLEFDDQIVCKRNK